MPAVLSWVLTVGWETVLVALATLATATVFTQLGWSGGTATKVVALVVVAGLVVAGGVLGFDLIMRMQTWITVITGVLTVVYIVLVAGHIHWSAVDRRCRPAPPQPFIGALIFVMTGFGFGWVNAAADYSRYLPRRRLDRAGSSAGRRSAARSRPVVLLVSGLLLAGSTGSSSTAIARGPDRRAGRSCRPGSSCRSSLVVVLGLVGGAVLDIYSSGLALLSLGLRDRARPVAAIIDGAHHGPRHDRPSSSSPTTSSASSRAS